MKPQFSRKIKEITTLKHVWLTSGDESQLLDVTWVWLDYSVSYVGRSSKKCRQIKLVFDKFTKQPFMHSLEEMFLFIDSRTLFDTI